MTRSPLGFERRIHDDNIAAFDRSVEGGVYVPLGTIAHGMPVFASGSYVFALYAAGGLDLTGGVDVAPNLQQVDMAPVVAGGSIYYPQWNSIASKTFVYDSAFVEVGDGVDLTGLGTQRYTAIGREPAERHALTMSEAGSLTSVRISVSQAVAADAAAYWTLTLVWYDNAGLPATARRRELGSFSTAARKMNAREFYDLYVPGLPLDYSDADQLHIEIVETGTAVPLTGLTAHVVMTRKVA